MGGAEAGRGAPRTAGGAASSPARLSVEPGPGVASIGSLSDYVPSLRGAAGDTAVYFLDSGRPGATMLVIGGTHPDEPAGVLAAAALVERAVPVEGRIIVVVTANALALDARPGPASGRPGAEKPVEGGSAGGEASFGSRLSSPRLQGADDPPSYSPPGSRAALPGHESRNLNRAYPGNASGSPTERVAFAVMEILRRERVSLALDLHEAPPDSRLAMKIVAHERALGLAAEVVLALEEDGITMGLEASPESMPGLSHREWGDRTGALAMLVETPNPDMAAYGNAAPAYQPSPSAVPPASSPDGPPDGEWPPRRRVAIHLAAIRAAIGLFDAAAGPGLGLGVELPPELLEPATIEPARR